MTVRPLSSVQPSGDGVDGDRSGGSVLDQLLTAAQRAEILQMRVSTVEDYARRGILPSIKLGRHRRFVRCQVECVIDDMVGDVAGGGADHFGRQRSRAR